MVDHPATIRIGDILAVSTLALTAASVQTYVAVIVGVLAAAVYLTKLIDWFDDRRDKNKTDD